MTDPVVARLHRCLVDAVRLRGEDPLRVPLTVAEIYLDLVPYREVRGTLGVSLNADYEHALLRLLGGEGGLLRVEPEVARAELRQEAEAPYPSVGLYRKYADSEVWITAEPAGTDDEASGDVVAGGGPSGHSPEKSSPTPSPVLTTPPSFPEPTLDAPGPAAEESGAEAPRTLAATRAASGPVASAAEGARSRRRVVARGAECPFCDQPLPVGRRVRHCPSCGSDQRLRPCPRCDEVLERTWRFCVNCGLEVPPVPTPRPPDPDE